MWVLGLNVLSRGITDSAIACGAAAGLALGAWRVGDGLMPMAGLLMILLLGTELFRPMRELRSVLHQGMVGMAAAKGILGILADAPLVADALPPDRTAPLVPSIAFENVQFRYPGATRIVHQDLDFQVGVGERIGVVGSSGGGKSSIVRLLLRFYDPEQGTIRLGGQELRRLSFDQIRAMVAVVSRIPSCSMARWKTISAWAAPKRPSARSRRQRRRRTSRLHRKPAAGLSDDDRREGRKALRRPAPARGNRPRAAARCADPGAGRGALGGRCRERGGDPRRRSIG